MKVDKKIIELVKKRIFSLTKIKGCVNMLIVEFVFYQQNAKR